MRDPHRRWLAAQDRFDAIRASLGPSLVADLAYANAWDGPSDRFAEALRDTIATSRGLDFQYTPYGGARVPRRVAADDLSEAVGVSYRWSDVTLTPGAMCALHLTLRSFASVGGNVVIPVPCWLDHPLYAADLGFEVRLVDRHPDTLELDVRAIADAIDDRTAALLLAQPCNPTGRVHPRATLEAISACLGDRLWISDECHRDYVDMVSPAVLHPRTAVIYSYGKRWGAQGQRLGAIAVRDDSIHAALRRNLRVGGYGMPTALMQRALPRLVEVRPDLERLMSRRARVLAALAPCYEVAPSHGTFFLYVRVPDGDDWAFTERLAARGVLVLPGAIFHHAGWVRLSLSANDDMIDRGIEVLLEAS